MLGLDQCEGRHSEYSRRRLYFHQQMIDAPKRPQSRSVAPVPIPSEPLRPASAAFGGHRHRIGEVVLRLDTPHGKPLKLLEGKKCLTSR